MDETRLQVLREKGREKQNNLSSGIWQEGEMDPADPLPTMKVEAEKLLRSTSDHFKATYRLMGWL